MGDDKARQKLEATARGLREKRKAEAAANARSAEHAEASRERSYRTSSLYRLTLSMSHSLLRWATFGLVLAAVAERFSAVEQGEPPSDGSGARIVTGLAALLMLYVVTGAARFWLWRKLLPFDFEGGEALGLGGAVTSARLRITFREADPPLNALGELATARLSNTTLIRNPGLAVLAVKDLETGVSNHELAAWLRRAVRRVLKPVHRASPIERVELAVDKVEEFHQPDMS